jgi:hypothetical protein
MSENLTLSEPVRGATLTGGKKSAYFLPAFAIFFDYLTFLYCNSRLSSDCDVVYTTHRYFHLGEKTLDDYLMNYGRKFF